MTSATTESTPEEELVLRCGELGFAPLRALVGRFGLELVEIEDGADIPGSYWGAPEAGLVGRRVYARADTPVHSLLHELGHLVCMSEDRRRTLETEAGGEEIEENGVCYLQILLADHLTGVGRDRLMLDMDRWGYSFRLGSTRAWFGEDADDARAWLRAHGLVSAEEGGGEAVRFRLRT